MPEKNLLSNAQFTPHKRYWFLHMELDKDFTGEISLEKKYLANCLCFEAVSPSRELPRNSYKSCSYKITVLLDDDTDPDLVLFDYTFCHCQGRQVLLFPTIPIKYSMLFFMHTSNIPVTCAGP